MTKQNALFVTVRQTPKIKGGISYRANSFKFGDCLTLYDERKR
ncbi:hypothetical protein [Lysinibacillus xylanilyticus]|nr:hypothetical protein [Lysinibacillus xylanilyticus]